MSAWRTLGLLGVCFAVAACTQQPDAEELFRQGNQFIERQDAPQALEFYQKSLDALGTDDVRLPLRAAVNSKMGQLFFDQQVLDEAMKAFREAYRCDSLAGDKEGMAYDLRDMANVFRADDNGDSCLFYFERALALARQAGDSIMSADVQGQMAAYFVYHGDLKRAQPLLRQALSEFDEEDKSSVFSIAAEYYSRAGMADSATYYYHELLRCGTVYAKQEAYRALADFCASRNETAKALEYIRMYEQMTDSVSKITDTETVRRLQSLYNYQLREREAARLRLSNQRLKMGSLSVVAVLAAVFFAAIQYFRRKRTVFQLKIERLERLLEASRAQGQKAGGELRENIRATEEYGRLLRLAEENGLLVEADRRALERRINTVYADFTPRLRSFCRLSAYEYDICLLLKAGFTPIQIATLTAHTKQSVATTRSRLYQKTFGKKGNSRQWDEFIGSL